MLSLQTIEDESVSTLNFNYTAAQEEVFFNTTGVRFVVVTKGRRVGFTRGAAQALIELALSSTHPQKFLWGETIFSNVLRYYELYFLPYLQLLPESVWEWRTRLMQLKIHKTIIDFRSADNPEMWEGFGYHLIYLNEAGIILKNANLYKKTVLPMLMDFKGSKLIAAGVPKGKKIANNITHPFFELWQNAEKNPMYKRFKFSSYHNPYLNKSDIDDLASALDEQTRLQEIYGEFIDSTDSPYLYAFKETEHTTAPIQPDVSKPVWFAFDFNIEPNSCIVGQQLNHKSGIVFDEISVKGSTEEVCNVLLAKYNDWIKRGLVFVTGDATGKNRNAMSGELTNYLIIKRKLNLRDYNLKVRHTNLELKASRVLCNSILHKLNIKLTTNCESTITDLQVAGVDGNGDLVKDSGLHKFDCFRYILESWFPDYLTNPNKYI